MWVVWKHTGYVDVIHKSENWYNAVNFVCIETVTAKTDVNFNVCIANNALFACNAVKENRIVIETGADQVRIELEKWAISSNETASEAAKAEAKKAQEAKAKAKAAKKAEKNQ